MKIKVTASIVLYKNDYEILNKAISSFLETKMNVFLYLIDNSPSDELRQLTSRNRVEYVHNPSNPGFGASHNVAIKKAFEVNSEYHLILNPDIYFNSGSLETIVSFMDSNLNVGHLMPQILYPNGELQYLCKQNPTFFDMLSRGFFPSFLKDIYKSKMDSFEYKNANYDNEIHNVPYLSGCFMFFRTSTLSKVGFFDERIFMYLEDADLTRRFLEFSDNVYYPKVKVYHYFAKLTHKEFKFKFITIKSAVTYFNKWGWF
ncbi:MAG: glycosyltransferase [Pseudarcicella sp.]|nr:glycosyltransferase [Pseudarcicella sp.]